MFSFFSAEFLEAGGLEPGKGTAPVGRCMVVLSCRVELSGWFGAAGAGRCLAALAGAGVTGGVVTSLETSGKWGVVISVGGVAAGAGISMGVVAAGTGSGSAAGRPKNRYSPSVNATPKADTNPMDCMLQPVFGGFIWVRTCCQT